MWHFRVGADSSLYTGYQTRSVTSGTALMLAMGQTNTHCNSHKAACKATPIHFNGHCAWRLLITDMAIG
jgi:hypothetical protein